MSAQGLSKAQQLLQLLRSFPPVVHAFAYGSGVMHQPGLYPETTGPTGSIGTAGITRTTPSATATSAARSSAEAPPSSTASSATSPTTSTTNSTAVSACGPATHKGPMLDLVFAVPDARAWHRANLALNPEHYAWIARSQRYGPDLVTGIAEVVGVGVHFNTLVPLGGQLVKYGVMEVAPLVEELTGWRQLFLAGRMHKPVHMLQGSAEVQAAQEHNLRSALVTALLLLPGSFSTEALLTRVCGLSYQGDVRMGLAEDPHKVQRIVTGSRQALEEMYLPLLRGPAPETTPATKGTGPAVSEPLASVVTAVSEGQWRQDLSYGGRLALLQSLPVGLLHGVAGRLGLQVPESHLQIPETLGEITARAMLQEREGHPLHHRRLVSDSLAAIVRRSSFAQAASGALAAGGSKAVEYLLQKLRKAAWTRQLPGFRTT